MNPFQAKKQINTGIEQYEAGRITLGALHTLVEETINLLAASEFDSGLRAADDSFMGDDEDDLYDVEFFDEEDGDAR